MPKVHQTLLLQELQLAEHRMLKIRLSQWLQMRKVCQYFLRQNLPLMPLQ